MCTIETMNLKKLIISDIKTSAKRWFVISGLILLFVLLAEISVIPGTASGVGYLILGVIVFILSFPLSVILRIDQIAETWQITSGPAATLLISCLLMLANFLLISALLSLRRYYLKKE